MTDTNNNGPFANVPIMFLGGPLHMQWVALPEPTLEHVFDGVTYTLNGTNIGFGFAMVAPVMIESQPDLFDPVMFEAVYPSKRAVYMRIAKPIREYAGDDPNRYNINAADVADFASRFGKTLSERIGQPVVIDNRLNLITTCDMDRVVLISDHPELKAFVRDPR